MSLRTWLASIGLGMMLMLVGPVLGCASGTAPFDDAGGEGGDTPSKKGLQGYDFRQVIEVQGTAPAGYSLAVILDHAGLVADGKSLATGDDVRVTFEDATGVTELDRVLEPTSSWNTNATKVWFRTVEGDDEGTYYLYYGNSGASGPPANASAIFLVFDDFEGGMIDAAWSVSNLGDATEAAVAIEGGAAVLSGVSGDMGGPKDSCVFLHREASGSIVIDAELKAASGSLGATAKMGGLMIRQSSLDDSRFQMISVLQMPLSRYSAKRETEGSVVTDTQFPITEPFPQLFQIQTINSQTTAGYSDDGVTYINLGDSAVLGLSDPFLVGVPLANISGGAGRVDTAWFRIRTLVSPQPTTKLADEEKL